MENLELYLMGSVEVICGPMFAGKTEELIRRARRMEYAHIKFLVFKPKLDDRYSKSSEVVSHNQTKFSCILIEKSSDIYQYLHDGIKAIIIDEAQFLDMGIVDVCDSLANKGLRVIVGGLDCDFKGKPFGPMPYLLAIADSVTKIQAICVKTGLPATKSQKLIDGKPASINSDVVMVGSSESYEPRCRKAHELSEE